MQPTPAVIQTRQRLCSCLFQESTTLSLRYLLPSQHPTEDDPMGNTAAAHPLHGGGDGGGALLVGTVTC